MRILICGQRTFGREGRGEGREDEERKFLWATARAVIDRYSPTGEDVWGISGGQRTKHPTSDLFDYGADFLGEQFFDHKGITYMRYPADWEKYGRRAGPIRNQQMLTEGKPTVVLAYYNNPGESKGTKDMVARARKAGVPTYEFVI